MLKNPFPQRAGGASFMRMKLALPREKARIQRNQWGCHLPEEKLGL
jgi:hypothetical protein